MGYVLSKVFGTLLAPGMLLVTGLAIGVVLLWSKRGWHAGRILLSTLLLGLLILLATPLQPWLTETLENRFPANPPLPERIDGIVILGGAVDPVISRSRQRISLNDAAERLTAGALLAKAHPEAVVVYSGGNADPLHPDPAEAPLAGALLMDLGVSPEHLRIEGESRNSYENALFSQRLVAPSSGENWLLVTSARHMPRAVGIFRRLNWPVIAYPVDYQSGGTMEWTNVDIPMLRLRLFAQALHEWLGLVFYRLNGWTDHLFPEPEDGPAVGDALTIMKAK
jgi:uncharacterized SAM-binding protein YcdF (DUF218 family)